MKQTKLKQFLSVFLLLILLFSSFYSQLLIHSKKPQYIGTIKEDNVLTPKQSQKPQTPLNYTSIYRNTTICYRSFQAINFTINASSYIYANYSRIVFTFSDGSSQTHNMVYISNTDKNFTYVFMPNGDTPLGFTIVKFLIYNITNVRLNTYTTETNFTVKTNYIASLDKKQLYRGDTLNVEIVVFNFSATTKFEWNASIVSTPGGTDIVKYENRERFSQTIDSGYSVNTYYYVKLNVTEINSGVSAVAYYSFFILNTAPSIIESSIRITPSSVLRTKSCQIDFNASDSETSAVDMRTLIKIEGPDGIIDTYENNTIFNNGDGSFTKNVSFRIERPIGRYQINITVFDSHDASDTFYTYLTVLNNPPEIHSYKINDQPNNESISIPYGEDLIFTFNVSDVENSIAYVTVALLDENNEWFNITRAYEINLTITIRSIDLVTGTWHVYIYVTDTDGATVGHAFDYTSAPQQITIEPDLMREFLPFIYLIIGITIGIIVGVGINYFLRSREKKYEELPIPEKKEIVEKPIAKKETVEGKPSKEKKLKREKKKEKKPKKKPEEAIAPKIEEGKEKEIVEEEEIHKEKDKKVVPRRKIKRKL